MKAVIKAYTQAIIAYQVDFSTPLETQILKKIRTKTKMQTLQGGATFSVRTDRKKGPVF